MQKKKLKDVHMYSLLQGPPTSQKIKLKRQINKINQQKSQPNVNKKDPAQNFLKHCSS